MTDETATASGRSNPTRNYRDGDTLVMRSKASDDVTFDLGCLTNTIRDALMFEGLVSLMGRGASLPDIVSGAALPDRSLPKGATKEPSALVKAIAAVKADQIAKAKRAGGEKVTKEMQTEISAEALKWALTLTDEQRKKLRSSAAVQVELGKLRGVAGSLDDLLASEADSDGQQITVIVPELSIAAE